MTSLEILDISRNQIRSIPARIANLTSLKVLAIAKNKIEELPVCLGDINSLMLLKLVGNPLVFPPPDVCTIKDGAPSPANENERDSVIAIQVKHFMRQQASRERRRLESERLRIESSGDESWKGSNPKTPQPLVLTSSQNERNRSQSEERQKRMSIHTNKGSDPQLRVTRTSVLLQG